MDKNTELALICYLNAAMQIPFILLLNNAPFIWVNKVAFGFCFVIGTLILLKV